MFSRAGSNQGSTAVRQQQPAVDPRELTKSNTTNRGNSMDIDPAAVDAAADALLREQEESKNYNSPSSAVTRSSQSLTNQTSSSAATPSGAAGTAAANTKPRKRPSEIDTNDLAKTVTSSVGIGRDTDVTAILTDNVDTGVSVTPTTSGGTATKRKKGGDGSSTARRKDTGPSTPKDQPLVSMPAPTERKNDTLASSTTSSVGVPAAGQQQRQKSNTELFVDLAGDLLNRRPAEEQRQDLDDRKQQLAERIADRNDAFAAEQRAKLQLIHQTQKPTTNNVSANESKQEAPALQPATQAKKPATSNVTAGDSKQRAPLQSPRQAEKPASGDQEATKNAKKISAKQKIHALKETIKQKDASITALKERIASFNRQRVLTQQKEAESKEALSKAAEDIARLNKRTQELETIASNASSERNELQKQVTDRDGLLSAAAAQIASLKANNEQSTQPQLDSQLFERYQIVLQQKEGELKQAHERAEQAEKNAQRAIGSNALLQANLNDMTNSQNMYLSKQSEDAKLIQKLESELRVVQQQITEERTAYNAIVVGWKTALNTACLGAYVPDDGIDFKTAGESARDALKTKIDAQITNIVDQIAKMIGAASIGPVSVGHDINNWALSQNINETIKSHLNKIGRDVANFLYSKIYCMAEPDKTKFLSTRESAGFSYLTNMSAHDGEIAKWPLKAIDRCASLGILIPADSISTHDKWRNGTSHLFVKALEGIAEYIGKLSGPDITKDFTSQLNIDREDLQSLIRLRLQWQAKNVNQNAEMLQFDQFIKTGASVCLQGQRNIIATLFNKLCTDVLGQIVLSLNQNVTAATEATTQLKGELTQLKDNLTGLGVLFKADMDGTHEKLENTWKTQFQKLATNIGVPTMENASSQLSQIEKSVETWIRQLPVVKQKQKEAHKLNEQLFKDEAKHVTEMLVFMVKKINENVVKPLGRQDEFQLFDDFISRFAKTILSDVKISLGIDNVSEAALMTKAQNIVDEKNEAAESAKRTILSACNCESEFDLKSAYSKLVVLSEAANGEKLDEIAKNLEKQYGETKNNLKKRDGELKVLLTSQAKKEAELKEQARKISDAAQDVARLNAKILALESETQDLQTRLRESMDAQKKMQEITEEKERLLGQISRLETVIERLKNAQNSSATSKSDETNARTQLAILRADMDGKKADLDVLKQQLETARTQRSKDENDHAQAIAQLTEQLSKKQEEKKTEQTKLAQANTRINELEREITKKTQEIDDIKERLRAKDQEDDANSQLAQRQREIEQERLQNIITDLDQQLKQNKAKVQEKDSAITELKTSSVQLQQQLQTATQEASQKKALQQRFDKIIVSIGAFIDTFCKIYWNPSNVTDETFANFVAGLKSQYQWTDMMVNVLWLAHRVVAFYYNGIVFIRTRQSSNTFVVDWTKIQQIDWEKALGTQTTNQWPQFGGDGDGKKPTEDFWMQDYKHDTQTTTSSGTRQEPSLSVNTIPLENNPHVDALMTCYRFWQWTDERRFGDRRERYIDEIDQEFKNLFELSLSYEYGRTKISSQVQENAQDVIERCSKSIMIWRKGLEQDLRNHKRISYDMARRPLANSKEYLQDEGIRTMMNIMKNKHWYIEVFGSDTRRGIPEYLRYRICQVIRSFSYSVKSSVDIPVLVPSDPKKVYANKKEGDRFYFGTIANTQLAQKLEKRLGISVQYNSMNHIHFHKFYPVDLFEFVVLADPNDQTNIQYARNYADGYAELCNLFVLIPSFVQTPTIENIPAARNVFVVKYPSHESEFDATAGYFFRLCRFLPHIRAQFRAWLNKQSPLTATGLMDYMDKVNNQVIDLSSQVVDKSFHTDIAYQRIDLTDLLGGNDANPLFLQNLDTN